MYSIWVQLAMDRMRPSVPMTSISQAATPVGVARIKARTPIVKDEVAVALRVGLALGRGVRFYFAKNPLDLTPGHVAHNVDEMAAVVRQAALSVAGDLEDLPLGRLCQ